MQFSPIRGTRQIRQQQRNSLRCLRPESLEARQMLSASQLFSAEVVDPAAAEIAGIQSALQDPDASNGSGSKHVGEIVVLLTTLAVDKPVTVQVDSSPPFNRTAIELTVESPDLRDYTMSVHAAADQDSQLEVLMMGEFGEASLVTIDVSSTGSWQDFATMEDVTVSLPSGLQTLQLKSLGAEVEIDAVTFTPIENDRVVETNPVCELRSGYQSNEGIQLWLVA